MKIALRDNKGNLNKGVIVGGALLVGLFGFGAYKLLKKGNNADALLDKVVNNLDTSKTTISKLQAQEIANRLYLAMKDNGTDETEIENLLIKNNNLSSEDIKMIVAAFGTKKYNISGAPMFDWMGGDDLDLRGWLYRECSSSLFEKINIKLTQAGFLAGGFTGCI